jgi:hypothetical protein
MWVSKRERASKLLPTCVSGSVRQIPKFKSVTSISLDSARWVPFADAIDARGRLTSIEGEVHLPFEIKRVFYVHQVSPGCERGGHAHPTTDQVAVAAHGTLNIDLSDGGETRTYELSDPSRGLYVPRMIWCRLYDFSPGALCLVFASTVYDPPTVIRTWDEYLAAARNAGREVRE